MLRYILLMLSVTLCIITNAQSDNYVIEGLVLEAGSEAPIEFANVILGDKNTGAVISGESTGLDGHFTINTTRSDVYIEISFLGYIPKKIPNISFVNNRADLGTIYIKPDSQALEEVVVRAEKSTTEFKLDKRVFNVGQDLSSTGASALEVLNNVPSVNANIEGAVSLRGSTGVQILINGKPSILTNEQGNALGTITADMIESVEVITNPSAKYEAEGTAGIINIILKKEEKKGINGSISLNTGVPHNHSLGLSVNKRSEKFNIFNQLGVGYREYPMDAKNSNIDRLTGVEISSTGEEYRNETFYNFILGTDYYINKLNVITLSGSVAYEVENQPSETFFERRDTLGTLDKSWTRTEVTEATNPKIQYELKYKKDFEDDKDHKLLFSAIGNYFGKDQSSTFANTVTLGSDDLSNQLTETKFNEGKYTFNIDYTKPFDDKWTIETGAQYLWNEVSNDYAVKNEENGQFVIDPGLTNVFEYNQKVFGAYGTAAYEGALWGIKLGLRAENTDLSTNLVNTTQTNNQKFTNLFPSAHSSYKLTDRISVQAGYSRRIYRPRLWDLNPFFNIRNNFNIRSGNPNLQPEYTDSYELGTIFIFEQVSFNTNIYHRYTTEVIERVATFDNGVNTTLPINIGTRKSTGLELNFKYSPSKLLTFNGDGNYNIFNRVGTFNDQVFDFDADQWSTKLTAKYRVNRSIEMEVSSRYQSDEKTIQGTSSGNISADFGMRYKIMNGRGVFNLSVRDVFASRFRENITDQGTFYSYNRGQRGRFITLGFSYGFGKGEAMEFSSGRRRH